jgi:DNA-binding transcriptional regulator PaaX
MNAEKLILQYLNDYKDKRSLVYKGVRTRFLGLPDFKYYKYQTLANSCSFLKKNGYIKEKNGEYFITYKGEEFLNEKVKNNFEKFTSNKTDKDPKDLLIIYDIPEGKKVEREWFRRELKSFNFVMIQKSAWVGPSPLPEKFLDYVKSIGLKENLKTFKLAKGYHFKKE